MSERGISLIAAMDEKRGIGKNGKIPWQIPGEQKYFKDKTIGRPIIMGRKTHESIGRVLPGRENIVIARNLDYQVKPGAVVAYSLEDAIESAAVKFHGEIFVIGGGEIYNQAISQANRLYLTIIEGDFEADTFFPDYSGFGRVIKEEEHEVLGAERLYKFKQIILEK